jgi:hypothetical protein
MKIQATKLIVFLLLSFFISAIALLGLGLLAIYVFPVFGQALWIGFGAANGIILFGILLFIALFGLGCSYLILKTFRKK